MCVCVCVCVCTCDDACVRHSSLVYSCVCMCTTSMFVCAGRGRHDEPKRGAPPTSAEFFGRRVRQRVEATTSAGAGGGGTGAAAPAPSPAAATSAAVDAKGRVIVSRDLVLGVVNAAASGGGSGGGDGGGGGGGDGGRGSYWDDRSRKLREQNGAPRSGIFSGVVVYINGRTGDVSACERCRRRRAHAASQNLVPRAGTT
jgi:hypothetical protein